MTENETPDRTAPAPPPGARRARMRRGLPHHLAQFCLGGATLLVVLAVALVAVLASGVSAPAWLRDRVAQEISVALPGHRLAFRRLGLGLDAGMAPRLALRGVTLRDAGGAALIDLGALDVTLSGGALLRGGVLVTEVAIDGGRLALRRRESGELSVAFEAAGGEGRHPATEAPATEQIGAMLAQPALAALRELRAVNLSLRYEDARSGLVWSADGGQVSLSRSGDAIALRGNLVVLGARGYASALEVTYSGRMGSAAAGLGLRFEDWPAREIAGQFPALAWLGVLEAPISGALRAEIDAGGRLGPLSATLRIAAGALRPNEAAAPIPFRAARSYLSYDPELQEIVFDELSIESDWGSARAEARARLVGMEAGWPSGLAAQIRLGEIVANPAGLYPEPVVFEGAAADIRLDFAPFAFDLGDFRLRDQGQVLRLRGRARAGPEGWSALVEGRMNAITPERLLALWPRTLKDKARAWLEENVLSARLNNIQLALRVAPDAPPDAFVGFDFADFSTVFVRDVPPIEGAQGHGAIRDNRLSIHAERGHVTPAMGGRLDISGTSFVIPDLRIRETPAEAHLRVRGPVTAALSLLDAPPFRFMAKAGQPVDLAEGAVDLRGRLDLLLKPGLTPEEVAFDMRGTLSDLRSDTLVAGRVLRAGALALAADNAGIAISGQARLGRVPFSGSWTMPFGPGAGGGSRVRGTVELSQDFVEEFGIGLPPGAVSGRGQATVEIALPRDGAPRAVLRSDLAGLGLGIPELGWTLAPGATGRLDVTATLGAPPRIDALTIEAGGLRAAGEVSLAPDGTLDAARFSRVELDGWLDVQAALIGRGAGVPPAVEVTGGRVDLRRGAPGGGDGAGGPVRLLLDELRITDGIALTGFRGDLDTRGGVRGGFGAQVNGRAAITGDIFPARDGRSGFRIRATDAGAALAAADLLQDARGGTLELTLLPAPEPGSHDGVLDIAQIRVKRAPALAVLLNAVSVVGLLEQFNGQGLHFGAVSARFRLTPERLILTGSSATGASVGLSMDGYYDLEHRRMDMQGVLSPVYVLNVIGGALAPRAGEGLFGFNFTLRGSVDNPEVSVNPLSALTPGFLREMFRRPAPTLEGAPPDVSRRNEARPSQPRFDGPDR
ncbi:MAG: hypothetical protein H5U16_11970 [Roseovarius sp.]|nr:hypothetical protein [Roseovarius sp.]